MNYYLKLFNFYTQEREIELKNKNVDVSIIKNKVMYFLKDVFTKIIVSVVVGVCCGFLAAILIRSVSFVTDIRTSNPWIKLFLPFFGVLIGLMYNKFSSNNVFGVNRTLQVLSNSDLEFNEQSYESSEEICKFKRLNSPILIPITFVATTLSHLSGASVGRLGACVQLGNCVSEFIKNILDKIQTSNKVSVKIIFLIGLSASVSSILGVYFAGTIFALEVVFRKKLLNNYKYIKNSFEYLFLCLISSFIAVKIAKFFGATYTRYKIFNFPGLSTVNIFKLVVSGVLFAIVGSLFVVSVDLVKNISKKIISDKTFKRASVIRTFVGGILILLFVLCLGTDKYNGLSTDLIKNSFFGEVADFDFLKKIILTSLSLGMGFQGGDVTPLFVIGSTFGATVGKMLLLPSNFVASIGYIGVFTSATKLPITCFILGIELFGLKSIVYMMIICAVSYLFSSKSSIYK
ncbi:MAG: chloride channel protein [Clostridioides sp.]|jgi:H+/Cl- antiporter ClcA|nr:chloride channel protein [Clostridioides sp.]